MKSHIDCHGSPKKCNNPFILSQLNEKLVSVGKKKWNNWLKTTAIYKIIENRFYWERDFIDIILDALHSLLPSQDLQWKWNNSKFKPKWR